MVVVDLKNYNSSFLELHCIIGEEFSLAGSFPLRNSIYNEMKYGI